MTTNAAVDLSNALGRVVENLGPSVVRVDDGRGRPSTGVVWDNAGLIVSASHSQENEDSLEVGLHDGTTVKATLVGFDNTTDVALLKVAAPLPAPSWSEGADLKVGNLVLALGRPGRTVRAAMGIAQAVGGDWRTGAGGKIDRYIQADVARSPGFSGGPLVDMSGGVLGMYSSALVRGGHAIVPTATLRRIVAALAKDGKVQRGFIGVGVHPVRLPDGTHGVLVISLQTGGPAEAAGLLLGDVILQLDGTAVGSPSELVGQLDPDKVGTKLKAKISRSGVAKDFTITVGARG